MKRETLKNFKVFDFGYISKYRLFFMGISTIWILLYHSPLSFNQQNGVGINHILYVLGFNAYLLISLAYVGLCIFMFFSGISLNYSMKKDAHYLGFVFRRIKRIIPEYLFVNIVWSFYRKRSVVKTLLNIIGVTFIQNSFRENWFFIMIVVIYLIYPFIFYCKTKYGNWTVLVMLFLSITVNICTSNIIPSLFNNVEIAFRSFPVFLLGVYVSDYVYEKKVIKGAFIYLLALVALCLSYRFIVNDINYNSVLLRYIYGINSVALVIITIPFLSIVEKTNIIRLFNNIGKYSMEFYLLYEKTLFVFSKYISNVWLLILISSMVCLALSYLLKELQNWLLN